MRAVNTDAPRRTQEQRSREMRARLLEATVECLVTDGYKGTTLMRVTRRAGTSVGAQQHHFPTKAGLVTSAVEYLAEARMAEIRQRVSALDGPPAQKLAAILDLMWETLSGRLNLATRELWNAARTDPVLRDALIPAEQRTGLALRELYQQVLEPTPAARDAMELAVDALRGLAIRQVLRGEAETHQWWLRHRNLILNLLEGEVRAAAPPAPPEPA